MRTAVRYFTRTGDDLWSKQGALYLRALSWLELPVRTISTTWSDSFSDPRSDFHDLGHMFLAELPEDAVKFNLVCGFADDFGRLWTQGMCNVAITGWEPRPLKPPEIDDVNRYDVVLTPRWDWLHEMRDSGVKLPRLLDPLDACLRSLLKELGALE